MGEIRTYRDLLVWQTAMALVTDVYRHSASFPKEELYGLASQMRRSAVSIPSNIAEGSGRHGTSDYLRFLQIAMGSLFELETQLLIAGNLGYLAPEEHLAFERRCREIERMLSALIARLREGTK